SAAPLTSRWVIGRIGHVNAMWLGALFAALAITVHAFLVTPVVWGGLRLLSGFALSSLYVAAESWIHDPVGNDLGGRVFSIYMVVQMIAMTVAQALLSVGDPKTAAPFLLAAGIFVLGALPELFARHTAPHRAPPEPFNIFRLFLLSPLGAIATV